MHPMRRWLTLLLLCVLPLQFAWAAAAAYCQHEQVPVSSHIGHHAHEHDVGDGEGAASPDKQGAGKSATKATAQVADPDCGYCQLSLAKPLMPVALTLDSYPAHAPDGAALEAFRSRGPDLLERPNWRLA
jgi:hypothetical protein